MALFQSQYKNVFFFLIIIYKLSTHEYKIESLREQTLSCPGLFDELLAVSTETHLYQPAIQSALYLSPMKLLKTIITNLYLRTNFKYKILSPTGGGGEGGFQIVGGQTRSQK